MYSGIVRGKGFWIYKSSQGTCNIDFHGATLTNPSFSINLKKGWNQISDGFDAVLDGGPSIEDYKGNCNILGGPWQYRNVQNDYIKSSILSWYDGYWIYVEKDCTLQKTCAAQSGTCRAWDPINGNCYSSEKEVSASECSNNVLQTHCCIAK
ncbi:MAG: hypothetical protein WA139_04285 [Candidatus Aenigmatarchaeota archaeon]